MKKCFQMSPEARPSFGTILEELNSLPIPEEPKNSERKNTSQKDPSDYSNMNYESATVSENLYHTTPNKGGFQVSSSEYSAMPK